MFTVITLTNEGKFVTLRTEDRRYHIAGAFDINAGMLSDFLDENDRDALYDFDMDYAFRMYRLSDSAVSMHLTWLKDDFSNAYTQSFILPVSMLRRVLSGKTVNAVVENDLRFYDPDVAREHLFMPRVIKACCM